MCVSGFEFWGVALSLIVSLPQTGNVPSADAGSVSFMRRPMGMSSGRFRNR
jgi:hypothetical protein